MKNKHYTDFDKAFETMLHFLNEYASSDFLQGFFLNLFISFFYANIINNFFLKLKKNIIKENNLPWGKIGKIKKRFKAEKREIKKAISLDLRLKNIDEDYYDRFIAVIKIEYPAFHKIISNIEKQIDIKKAKEYLIAKKREIKDSGKKDCDLNITLLTTTVEAYIRTKKHFPKKREFSKIISTIGKAVLPTFSIEITKSLVKSKAELLNYNRVCQNEFEKRLHNRWKEPIDLLECFIQVSYESGEKLGQKLFKTTDNTNKFKREALFKIHARALQISKEILELLKSGYSDGANARWRTLYELSVIMNFLEKNNNDVSKRYLEHNSIREYKEAIDYKSYYKKLGYLPIERKAFNRIEKAKEALITNYGNDFMGDYGWIPKSILSDRNFRGLEKHVRLDRYRPYYNLACDASHGGPKGFFRLGLSNKYQNKIYLSGPSNYGLSEPLQNSAISLLQISACLLIQNPDFEEIISMNILKHFVDDIRSKANEAHVKLVKDEKRFSR